MSEPHTQPDTWGQASGGWSDEFFQMRLYQTKSLPHLRAALAYEKDTRERPDRIERINEQIDLALSLMDNDELTEQIEEEIDSDETKKAWVGRLNGAKE